MHKKLLIGLIILTAVVAFKAQVALASGLSKQANSLGLVGYWSLEDGAGTVTTDFSGNGNTATLVNSPTWVSGKRGRAVNLARASSQYVTIANYSASNFGTAPFTVAAWFKKASNGIYGGIVSAGAASDNPGWSLNVGAGNEVAFFTSAIGGLSYDSTTSATSSVTITDTNWHFAVGVRNGTNVKLYVDGVQVDSVTDHAYNVNNGSVFPAITFGPYRSQDLAANFFNGSIDEVRLYNRALSSTEIAALYASGIAKINSSQNSRVTNGLVGLWSFDGADIISTTAYDRSGNGSNGTLTGSLTNGVLGQGLGSGAGVAVATYSGPTLGSSSDFTIAFWVKPSDIVSDQYLYDGLKAGGSGDNNPAIILGFQDNYFNIFIDGYAGGNANNTKVPATANEWQHLVYTSDGSNVKGYINGALSVNWSGSFRMNGNLTGINMVGLPTDDVRVYNRAITAAEVLQLYNLGKVAVNKSNVSAAGTNSLVLWQTFDGGKVNTSTSTDSSGQGNTGTLTGAGGAQNKPQPALGKVGQALNFDGTDDYVDVGNPSSLQITGDMTISAWIKPKDFSTYNSILSKTGSGGNKNIPGPYDLYTAQTTGIIRFFRGNGVNDYRLLDSSSGLVAGAWSHVAVAVSSAHFASIYINGISDASGTMAILNGGGTVSDAGQNAWVGARSDGTVFMNGALDDVRVYSKVLSATEVLKLYNAGK